MKAQRRFRRAEYTSTAGALTFSPCSHIMQICQIILNKNWRLQLNMSDEKTNDCLTGGQGAGQPYTDRAARGSRRSRQLAEAIESLVKEVPKGTHLTAPEVFKRARDIGLNISLSTVYRTLHVLQAHGNVSTVSGDRGMRYEASGDGEDHDHLICVKCGLTIEFFDDLIRGFGKSVAQRKGYEHRSSRFDILGICADCKAQDEDHRIQQSVVLIDESVGRAQQAIALLKRAAALNQARKTARGAEFTGQAIARLKEALALVEESADLFAGAQIDRLRG